MLKLTYTLNVLWISVILFSTVSVQGMKKTSSVEDYYLVRHSPNNALNKHEKYIQQAAKAEQYNKHYCPLTRLSIDIFSHCLVGDKKSTQSLMHSIKNFINLRTTCRHFNRLLTFETIGSLCKNYARKDKDQALKNFMKDMGSYSTKHISKRLPALILLCAGAHPYTTNPVGCDLLEIGVRQNDIQLVKILFQHHANPNRESPIYPMFFYAKTVEMAQLFIENNVNVRVSSNIFDPNVLWYILEDDYPSELIQFYLTQHVDATKLRSGDNSCLLHALAKADNYYKKTMTDNRLTKAVLLLGAMPGMVNTLNKKEQTPLDVAQDALKNAKEYKKYGGTPKPFKQLIALFREYDGLTAEELKQQVILQRQAAQEDEHRACIICMETPDNMIGIPCKNIHPERICIECYNESLKVNDKCPICRKPLTQ